MVALVTAAPGAAQVKYNTGDEVRRTLRVFADCVVQRHAEQAFDVLQDPEATAPGTITREARRLIDSRCLGSATASLQAPADLYWPAIAEALIAEHHMLDGQQSFERVSPLLHPAFSESPSDADAASSPESGNENEITARSRYALMSRLGECTVRRDSAKSQQILKTEVASDEERAAAQALAPTIGSCFTKGNISFNVPMIRAMVALNYFKLAAANEAQPNASDIH